MDASTALRMTVTMATNGTGAALANFGGPNTMIKGDTRASCRPRPPHRDVAPLVEVLLAVVRVSVGSSNLLQARPPQRGQVRRRARAAHLQKQQRRTEGQAKAQHPWLVSNRR